MFTLRNYIQVSANGLWTSLMIEIACLLENITHLLSREKAAVQSGNCDWLEGHVHDSFPPPVVRSDPRGSLFLFKAILAESP